MKIGHDRSYLIIADSCYRNLLIDCKAKDPLLDWKIVTRKEAIAMLSFAYVKDPIPFLLTKREYNYTNLKNLVKLLQVARFPQGSPFQKLVEELRENGFLKRDEIGFYQMQQKTILLFEDDEDEELCHLLKDRGLSYSFLHFEDLDFPRKDKGPSLFLFPDKIHQFAYLFADLRKKVLREKKGIETFQILIHDDKDRYFVDLFSDLFSIPAFYDYHYPLLSNPYVKKAMDDFERSRLLSLDGLEGKAGLGRLKELVEHYGLEEIAKEDFDYAFLNLMEIVKSESIVDDSKAGVPVTSDVPFDDHKTYYVTDFQYGDFYKVQSDKGLFSDSQLQEMGANPSFVKTKLDRRKKANFFKYMDVVFFSRVELHLSDKIFPSQLLSEIPEEEGKKPFKEVKKDILLDGLYTTKAKFFLSALTKDTHFARPDSDYRSYDNAYTPIGDIPEKEKYAVTGFADYYSCPFKYYLDKVLYVDRKDPEQDYFSRKFGTFVHHLYENIYEENYDFDKEWERARKDFEEDAEYPKPDSRQLALLESSRDYVRRFISNVRQQRLIIPYAKEEHERKIDFFLESPKTGRKYHLVGSIDKILYTRFKGENFFSIIDYKTGNESFDYKTVFYGNSLQLPLYYIGLQEEGIEETFGAFGIQKVFKKRALRNKDTNSYDAKAVTDYMKIHGIARSDLYFFRSIDDDLAFTCNGEKLSANGGSYVSKSLSFEEDPKVGLKKNLPYTFADVIEDAKKAAVRILDRIRENQFPIAPTISKANEEPSCRFCPYRDICYRKVEDIQDISLEIQKHLGSFSRSDKTSKEEE